MKERKDTPGCHLFETEWSTFVCDVGSNELLTLVQELVAVLILVGTRSETSTKKMNREVKFYCRKSKVLVVQ